MVKRSAALAIVDMAKAAAAADQLAVISEELVPHISDLSKDMQDSVRVCAVEALVGMIAVWTQDPNNAATCFASTNALVLDAINDQSWRVRHAMAGASASPSGSVESCWGSCGRVQRSGQRCSLRS